MNNEERIIYDPLTRLEYAFNHPDRHELMPALGPQIGHFAQRYNIVPVVNKRDESRQTGITSWLGISKDL
ncbi:hypothetical protein O9G_005253 [Rozella allomycis CSF55]|uniref:Uncharacterized protein n=1 Tax=Rozella allomycis (strain CSF55) TaxID=988480 RepID=A0A075AUD1_ROZAC|nr:hypothetical protein O9G_005253 [Rozella allomycis CSF55]|eukprot:EPZ33770.1 hypothetical protein O9G_005253 [Rozella allomycis CSF55]